MTGQTDVADIERWFLDRGTPQLIEQYSASEDVLTRALPFLTLVFLLELTGALNADWPWWANVLAAAGAAGLLLAIWAMVNRAHGRPALARPARVGPVELAVFALVPPLFPAVFNQQFAQAAAILAANVVILAGTYAVFSYGLVPLTRWATARMFRELGELLGLLTRALPLLLLFVTFLFVNTEVWQVSEAMEWEFHVATVVMFMLMGGGFLLTRLPTELDRLARFQDDAEVDRLCADTPAAPVATAIADLDQIPTDLSRRQRVNVLLVVIISEAIQITLVALTIFVFFVVFGLVAIRPDVVASWVGDAALDERVGTFTFGGNDVVLTAALLRVAGFLAAFSGFYFTVYAVTDANYREAFFDRIAGEMRQTFAVRAAYLALLGRRSS